LVVNSKLMLGLGLVVVLALAWFAMGRGDEAAMRRATPLSFGGAGGDEAVTDLLDAPERVRSLGIARANFMDEEAGMEPEPPPDPRAELTPKEKRLYDEFQNGPLRRTGNFAVFAAPGAQPDGAPAAQADAAPPRAEEEGR
jgi:hypothetical protein